MSNAIDSAARRAAKAAGFIARKSRRCDPANNNGGYMLIDVATKFPVVGFQYDLSAEDVIDYCKS